MRYHSVRSDVHGAGNASVKYSSGTINVSGNRPRGIFAWAEGDGSATVTTGPGTIITVSGEQPGGSNLAVKPAISVQLDSATAANGQVDNCERGIDNHELRDRRSRFQSFQQPLRYSSH